jgi:hypothetical protein
MEGKRKHRAAGFKAQLALGALKRESYRRGGKRREASMPEIPAEAIDPSAKKKVVRTRRKPHSFRMGFWRGSIVFAPRAGAGRGPGSKGRQSMPTVITVLFTMGGGLRSCLSRQ